MEKKEIIKKKEKRKVGRPTILTPELKARLIKLFEENFFMAAVAAKSDIYRQQIFDWIRERKDFQTAVNHAKDVWIQKQLVLLREYSKDKRTKDWRALKYLLSIADIEFNDKKYLKDTGGKGNSTTITINLNRKDLEDSKAKAARLIGSGTLQEETISLIPFQEEKKEKVHRLTRKEKIERATSQ